MEKGEIRKRLRCKLNEIGMFRHVSDEEEVVEFIEQLLNEAIGDVLELFGDDIHWAMAMYADADDEDLTKDAVEFKQKLIAFKSKHLKDANPQDD